MPQDFISYFLIDECDRMSIIKIMKPSTYALAHITRTCMMGLDGCLNLNFDHAIGMIITTKLGLCLCMENSSSTEHTNFFYQIL